MGRTDDMGFEFKAAQARARAERDRIDRENEPVMLDVLGAVLGAVGITMPSMKPSTGHVELRRRRGPLGVAGPLVGVFVRGPRRRRT